MNRWQSMVEEFHRETGSTVGPTVALRDNELRAKLIMEEAVETCAALGFGVSASIYDGDPKENEGFGGNVRLVGAFWKIFDKPDLLETIDGLCDLIYVICGTAVAAGVDLDPHYAEVQKANMMKLLGPKRADGKQLKPEGWKPPDHAAVLAHSESESRPWIRPAGSAIFDKTPRQRRGEPIPHS